ncbi:10367_t:CDS:2, partial [Cetraspora pellucida]
LSKSLLYLVTMPNIDETTVVRGRDLEMDVIRNTIELEAHRAIIEVPSQDQGERPSTSILFNERRYLEDNGIDVFGPYKKYILVFQCKNYTRRRYVTELIGVLNKFPDKHTIGIFVTSLSDGYVERARLWAEGSNIPILLTSIWNLEQVLLNLPWNPYAINEESLQKMMEESLKLAYRQEDRTKSIKQKVTQTHQDMKELSLWILWIFWNSVVIVILVCFILGWLGRIWISYFN